MSKPLKYALVTGASRGIGKEVAAALVREGYQVTGTCREPEKLSEEEKISGVFYASLDLMDENSICSLLSSVEKTDVLINNAGASQMGPVEEVSMEKMEKLFQLNLFGHIRLMQGIIPKMRARGGGTIINVTSLASHLPVPFSSVYAAGKAAMEVLTNGLRNELLPFGIRAVTVAPSFVKTGIFQEKICPEGSVYQKNLHTAKAIRDANIAAGTDPADIAQEILKIIRMKNPAPFYAVGKGARLLSLTSKLLPGRWVENSIRKKFNLGSLN